jgi:hypothetical protein
MPISTPFAQFENQGFPEKTPKNHAHPLINARNQL